MFYDIFKDRGEARAVLAQEATPGWEVKDALFVSSVGAGGYELQQALADLVALKEWLSRRLEGGPGRRAAGGWLVPAGIGSLRGTSGTSRRSGTLHLGRVLARAAAPIAVAGSATGCLYHDTKPLSGQRLACNDLGSMSLTVRQYGSVPAGDMTGLEL